MTLKSFINQTIAPAIKSFAVELGDETGLAPKSTVKKTGIESLGAGQNSYFGADDNMKGTGYHDILKGGGGDDTIQGFGGLDVMDGGQGNDTLLVTEFNGAYHLNMVTGHTNYAGETASNFENVHTGNGADHITGTDGVNYIYTNGGDDRISAGDGNDWIYSGDGDDRIDGGYGNDQIQAGAGDDHIGGGWGTDVISAGYGDDMVWGGAFSDVIWGGSGDDQLSGDEGRDTIFGGQGDDYIWGGTGHDTLKGDSGNDGIVGGSGNDKIEGGSGNDMISGGAGRDKMDGGSGWDTLLVNEWNGTYKLDMETGVTNFSGETAINFEAVITGNGDDTIQGTDSGNEIETRGGDDVLDGLGGWDELDAGAGNDVLIGGEGFDRLTGGEGEDVFVFNTFGDRDVITDFEKGKDVIDLSAFDLESTFDLTLEAGKEPAWVNGELEWTDYTVVDYGAGEVILAGVTAWHVNDDYFDFG